MLYRILKQFNLYKYVSKVVDKIICIVYFCSGYPYSFFIVLIFTPELFYSDTSETNLKKSCLSTLGHEFWLIIFLFFSNFFNRILLWWFSNLYYMIIFVLLSLLLSNQVHLECLRNILKEIIYLRNTLFRIFWQICLRMILSDKLFKFLNYLF